MGGTKNRDAKMKANKVFSCGGGGGTKGPAVVDKRGQEVKCPYCDKIYQQSGRLKDHIAKQHADQLQPEQPQDATAAASAGGSSNKASGSQSSGSAAVAGSGAGSSAASNASKQAAGGGASGSGSTNAALAAAAAAAARLASAAAAAAAGAGKGAGVGVAAQGSAPGAAAAAASGTSGGTAGGGMMQINSRAGYYTCKSPSMHLHEWIQREKRPRARVVPRKTDNGMWTCKVVLPDPKREEDDIVVWLDEAFAAPDEQEARERGAVAALNRVQGDRALERILPRDYVPLWGQLGEARKAREEQEAGRRAAEQRRKQQEEARRKRAGMRGPQVVVMSAAKQRLVQALLRDRDDPLATHGSAGSPSAAASADDADALADMVDKLSDMRFSPQHVQLAYERRAAGGAASVEALLDWLLLNLPPDQLPGQFTKGSKTNMVGIVARAGSAAAGAAAGSGGGGGGGWEPSLQSVARLMSYGYLSAECEEALKAEEGDEVAAHVRMYGLLTGVKLQAPPPSSDDNGSNEADNDAWAEELMVLESIYDSQFAVLSEDAVRLSLELPEGCAVATRADAPLVLEFVRLRGDGGGGAGALSYPDAAPLVSVSCAGLAAGALRHLTSVLAEETQKLLGQPAIHELASRALEEAANMSEEDTAAAAFMGMAGGAGAAAVAGARATGAGNGGKRKPGSAAKAPLAAWDAEEGAEQEEEAQGGEGGLERQESSLVEGFEGLVVEDEEPEEDEEGGEEAEAEASGGRRRAANAPRSAVRAPPASAAPRGGARAGERLRRRPRIDIAAESARLSRLQGDLETGPQHETMRRSRRSLPAFAQRGELLRLLRGCEVVVVSGATGCGKSTQVPQYILEDAIAAGSGAACNIIVTQPRRISALGLAARVANERGERVGEVVGYSVKLDHKSSAATRLTFVTTGILLRRLLSDPDLEGTTHIVLDEVHERSIEIDLLLLLLRDLLARRREKAAAAGAKTHGSAAPPLKLVLMSATADAQLFADYYTGKGLGMGAAAKGKAASRGAAQTTHGSEVAAGSAGAEVGMMSIPGFTYPVREFYLEDAFEMTKHEVGRGSRFARRGGGGGGDKDADGGDGDGDGGGGGSKRQLSYALPSYSERTLRSLSNVDEGQINYDLLVDLISEIISRHRREGSAAFMSDWPQAYSSGRGDVSGGGALLVFLPGAPEISRLQRMLLASDKVSVAAGGRNCLRVLPLHGSLSSADQSRVFARPPSGCFKVVLSTNVAETSITIDDVTVVLDTGRVKEMCHDPERGIQRLQEGWVSQAAAQQRRGRAGRVRPGICFRVFSSEQWRRMPHHTQPEMLRSPLESVCLLVKGMTEAAAAGAASGGEGEGGVAAFLSRSLSPPPSAAVSGALRLLRSIGAFDGSEALTSLGRHLNRMPMDPRVGKALVYGSMLGCLDPVLTVTAAMAHGRPVFMNLQGAPENVVTCRQKLLRPAETTRSDHIALIAAYNAWTKVIEKAGRSAGSQLCADCGLSESSLEAIRAGRNEYARVLAELGFLDGGDPWVTSAGNAGGEAQTGVNRNAGNARFLKAALCAGFYPSVLRVQHPKAKFVEVSGGAFETEADPKDLKLFDRERGRVFLHPGSVCFSVGKFESGWLVYTQITEMVRDGRPKLVVREASMVPVYALLLFGGELAVEHAEGRIRVDGWAEFKAAATVGVMVRELRSEMDRLLGAKIGNPSLQLGSNRIVAAVEELLSTDGF